MERGVGERGEREGGDELCYKGVRMQVCWYSCLCLANVNWLWCQCQLLQFVIFSLSDKVIQLIALRWMDAFLELSGRTMLCFAANILVAVLPCVAFDSDKESELCQILGRFSLSYFKTLVRHPVAFSSFLLCFAVLDSLPHVLYTLLFHSVYFWHLFHLFPFLFLVVRVGIRKVASKVNNQLKNLVVEADDEDLATDLQDETNIRSATRSAASSAKSEVSRTSPASTSSSNFSGKDSESTGIEGKEIATKGTTDKTRSSQGEASSQEPCRLSLLTVLGVLIPHMKFTAVETRLETLRWVLWLHNMLPTRVGMYLWSGYCDV